MRRGGPLGRPAGTVPPFLHLWRICIENARIGEGGGTITTDLNLDRIIGSVTAMKEDGTFDKKIYRIDENVEKILFHTTVDEKEHGYTASANEFTYTDGDDAIFTAFLTGDMTMLYRAAGDQLEEIGSVAGLDIYGAYLRGSTLLTFLPGEGYYTIDIATGEQVKAADRQLSSGWGFVFQPNCILETTVPIGWRGSGPASQGGEGLEMVLYDGTSWRPVTLPQELGELEEGDYVEPLTLASDRILFSLHRETGHSCRIYQLPLQGDSLEVVFCAEIGK